MSIINKLFKLKRRLNQSQFTYVIDDSLFMREIKGLFIVLPSAYIFRINYTEQLK